MSDGYVRAYRSFLQLRELKHSDKMVFLGLWSFGNTSGICWPSHKELARASAVSPRQVRTSLNNLAGMGLVMTEKRKTGRLSSLRYLLAPLEQAAGIVAGKKKLEDEKNRWVEALGETTTEGQPSAGEGNGLTQLTRSDRKKLPPPPGNGEPPENTRKILPLPEPSQKPIRQDQYRELARKTPDRSGKGHLLPPGTAFSATSAEISADRTRTKELKPGKKNQVQRPWERYLKPQSPQGKSAGGIPQWGEGSATPG